eukprot:403336209
MRTANFSILKTSLLFTTAFVVSIQAQDLLTLEQPKLQSSLTVSEVAQFVEGWLAGVTKTDTQRFETCITEVEDISKGIVSSVQSFEKLSFSGIKEGLHEISETVKKVPNAIKDCKDAAQIDFTEIFSMIEIFSHPLQLIYNIGKNLYMNGIDIYHNIQDGVAAYKTQDYQGFGLHIGNAMEEIFKHAPFSQPSDQNGMYSQFYKGFFETHQSISDIDSMKYFEQFDKLGLMITGPSGEAINNLRMSDGKYQEKIRDALDKVSQALMDSSALIVGKEDSIITKEQQSKITTYAQCIKRAKPMESEEFLQRAITDVIKDYGNNYVQGLGTFVGNIAKEYCLPRQRIFLKKQQIQIE